MPNYDYQCEECGVVEVAFETYANRYKSRVCQLCGGPALWTPAMPAPMRAAYPDGHRRKGWADLKEAAKLGIEKAAARPEHKKEISAEIKKLGVKLEK